MIWVGNQADRTMCVSNKLYKNQTALCLICARSNGHTVYILLQINQKETNVHNNNLFFLWSFLSFFSNVAFLSSLSSLLFSMLALNLFIWISSTISKPCWYITNPLYLRKKVISDKKYFLEEKFFKKNTKTSPTLLSSSSPFHCCLCILFSLHEHFLLRWRSHPEVQLQWL